MINLLAQHIQIDTTNSEQIKTLSELIMKLVARDNYGPLCVTEAFEYLSNTKLTTEDFAGFAEENDQNYSRNRLFLGKNMELLVLTWKSGQASRIHDHAGSVCCIKVLDGQALEIKFIKTNCGKYIPKSSEDILRGAVVSSIDDDVHLIANTEPERLVTLHLYSPPLKNMQIYGPEDTIMA